MLVLFNYPKRIVGGLMNRYNQEGSPRFSRQDFARPRLSESSPEISSRSSVDWTSSRFAREASSLANYPARVPLGGHTYAHNRPPTGTHRHAPARAR